MSTEIAAPIPERIGPYKIDRILGTGGMGAVYHGVHEKSGEEAAVKILPANMARQSGFVQRFNREIIALQKVSNPHIVSLLDSGVDGETHYYAMEFVDGQTLTDVLDREGRLPWQTVINFGVQICSALKSAHDSGIIHRDLKPGNLLVDSEGTVKLADFGVAQVFAENKLTVTGGVVGTAAYMSPEQARGVRVTRKSDLYSLGAVLYSMLTGRPPFSGVSTVDMLHKHQFGQFEKPSRIVPELPSWLDELVCQLLDKDPEKRPPDAHVLSRRLTEIVKKIELSQGQETRAPIEHSESANRMMVEVGPTLMRDLVRSEIERETNGIAGVFDNLWVLLASFTLLVLGGVWWFQWRATNPDELFEQGVALMSNEEGSDWLIAEDDHFKPLLELDEKAWGPKVQPFLDQISDYKLRRQQQRSVPGNRQAGSIFGSEPERLLSLAKRQRDNGAVLEAMNTTTALITLIKDDRDHVTVLEQASKLLLELQTASGSRVSEFITRQWERAAKLKRQGRSEEAAEIRTSLRVLYGKHPTYRSLIESGKSDHEE